MTHHDAPHYSAKHGYEKRPDPVLLEAVKKVSSDGAITCHRAHKIASEFNKTPSEIGFIIDMAELRIQKCQLGLFGYGEKRRIVKPAQNVSAELEKAIRDSLVNERLSCASAWSLAEKFSLSRMEIASACEKLEIKIKPCQLGSF